jgi:hypothetical protein
VGVERGSAPVAFEALTLPSAPSRAAVMPMRIVDPGFRPRLMLEAAEALELVRRAADAWATAEEAAAAAAAGPQSGATSATAADSAGMPLDDPSLVRLFQRHAVDGDTIHSATVTHVQRLWAGMGAVLEVRAETAGGRAGSQPVSALLIIKKVLLPRGALSFGAQAAAPRQIFVVHAAALPGTPALVAELNATARSPGDARKKVSYECESRFYEAMAGQLRVLGCSVPAGLLVDRSPETIVIVMSKMPGSPTLSGPEPHEGDVAEREAAQVREYGQVVFSEDSDEPGARYGWGSAWCVPRGQRVARLACAVQCSAVQCGG